MCIARCWGVCVIDVQIGQCVIVYTLCTLCRRSPLPQAVSFIRKGDCDTAIVVGCSLRSWSDYLVQMQVCLLVHVGRGHAFMWCILEERGPPTPLHTDTIPDTRAPCHAMNGLRAELQRGPLRHDVGVFAVGAGRDEPSRTL
jgi:hypothetical protein